MNKLGDYILVESIDELKKQAAWENDKDISVIGLGIFYDVHDISYPHVFVRGRDLVYKPCSKADMLLVTETEIMMLKSRIKGYEELCDKLEKVSE
jgi:hypothetical protein